MVVLESKLVWWVEGNFGRMVCKVGRVRAVSHSKPQTPRLRCLQMCKIGPHILCGFGRGKLSRWAVHSKEADVMQRFGAPLSTHTLDRLHFKFPRFDLIGRNPQTWSGLKACICCWSYRISCVWTLIRSRQGHPRNTPSRPPPTNPTSQHQIIMQEKLKSWKAEGLEQVWGCTICLPKGCKMVPGWPKAHTPRPLLAFPHTGWLFMTYVHVVHGWFWKWGQQVGGNANWPCLGGSSGGDDH